MRLLSTSTLPILAGKPAPAVFSLDHDGKLSFRRQAAGSYVSGDLDESLRADVEEAADVCPLQAITVED